MKKKITTQRFIVKSGGIVPKDAVFIMRQGWEGEDGESLADFCRRLKIRSGDGLKEFIRKTATETARAFGGCVLCFGKGYSTEIVVAASRRGGAKVEKRANLCSCERGGQLALMLKEKLFVK